MYKKLSFIKKKIRGLCLRFFDIIENNNNCNLFENGERLFIKNLLKKIKQTKNKIIIFDIGANVGNYSTILIEEALKLNLDIELHLFEPLFSCFKVLKEKFLNKSNIYLNNFGISEKEGKSLIYFDQERSGLASLYKRDLKDCNINTMDKSEEIILKRLDDYIKEKEIPHVDFIKIDVEGHEMSVLNSMGHYLNIDFIDYIQFEYGGCNIDSRIFLKDIYNLLNEKNFYICKILRNGLEIREYKTFMENFKYANYVAVSKNNK